MATAKHEGLGRVVAVSGEAARFEIVTASEKGRLTARQVSVLVQRSVSSHDTALFWHPCGVLRRVYGEGRGAVSAGSVAQRSEARGGSEHEVCPGSSAKWEGLGGVGSCGV